MVVWGWWLLSRRREMVKVLNFLSSSPEQHGGETPASWGHCTCRRSAQVDSSHNVKFGVPLTQQARLSDWHNPLAPHNYASLGHRTYSLSHFLAPKSVQVQAQKIGACSRSRSGFCSGPPVFQLLLLHDHLDPTHLLSTTSISTPANQSRWPPPTPARRSRRRSGPRARVRAHSVLAIDGTIIDATAMVKVIDFGGRSRRRC